MTWNRFEIILNKHRLKYQSKTNHETKSETETSVQNRTSDGNAYFCLGRYDLDFLDHDDIRFHHKYDRVVGGLHHAADQSWMVVHLRPLNQRLTARTRLATI